jgi:hypothetical protein
MMGSIGALVPFTSREDVDFFSHLEMHLRQENPPLCGRDHLAYRSYYFPVKVTTINYSKMANCYIIECDRWQPLRNILSHRPRKTKTNRFRTRQESYGSDEKA